MAWYDDYLQQGRGLVQRGQNWLTGNNLTSQNPNTIRAMNAQPFNANARISDTSFSDRSYEDPGFQHPPKAFPRDTSGMYAPNAGNIHRDPTPDWRGSYIHDQFGNAPELFSNEPRMMNLNRDGIMGTDKVQDKTNFLQKILNNTLIGKVMGGVKRPEEMQTAYESITGSADDQGYGTYKGNQYKIQDGKIYSELYPHGKNFDSGFGSKSIEEMENEGYGSIGWAQDRLQKGKKISKRLHDILQSRGIGKGGNWMDRPTDEGAQFKPDVPVGPIDTGQKPTYEGPAAVSFNPQQFAKAGRRATVGRGFSDPGKGSYGPWKADGGRIGYQDGELVEQETDFIEGPHGGEEFQETVVEGQEQPSREQLEALAMEIFQLPLEQLDEQQLLVVYQEAMQGRPMEEAVQEEDVQFAAQGGLAGLL